MSGWCILFAAACLVVGYVCGYRVATQVAKEKLERLIETARRRPL